MEISFFLTTTTHDRKRLKRNINIILPQKSYKWIFQQQKPAIFAIRKKGRAKRESNQINDIFFIFGFS